MPVCQRFLFLCLNSRLYWLRYGAGGRLMIRDFTVATTAIFVGTYIAIMAAVVTVGVLR